MGINYIRVKAFLVSTAVNSDKQLDLLIPPFLKDEHNDGCWEKGSEKVDRELYGL
jgi:hypothetical protein